MSGYALNELDRRLANMVRIGTVSEVDATNSLAKVAIGEITTDWLHWTVTRAGKTKTWWTPDVGEQVVVLSPGGELGQGVILGSIFQSGTSGFEGNGSETDVQRITLDSSGKYEIAVGSTVMLHIESGKVKAGNGPTQHASIGEVTLAQLNKITTYLQAISTVWASPIPEPGMGSPSSLGAALNIAGTAAGGVPTMSDPSATDVFVK